MEQKTDHDILIRVETKLEGLTDEVRKSNDGLKDQIMELKNSKVDTKVFSDLSSIVEKHDKMITRYGWLVAIGVGIVLTLQFVTIIAATMHANVSN